MDVVKTSSQRSEHTMLTRFLYRKLILIAALALLLCTPIANAQGTSFTYQGKLSNVGNPATGSFDMQFKVFDALTGGTQQGATVTNTVVQATAGIFTVELDFGAGVFDGAARYLEIGVRPVGSPDPYTVLAPRQGMTATPYALHSMTAASADGLSAACVNCVTGDQVQSIDGAQITGNVAGSQISGEIPPESVPTGSGNYIQNASALQKAGKNSVQQSASLSIDGNASIGGNSMIGNQLGIGGFAADGMKLDVGGNAVFRPLKGTINIGSPNNETGMTIAGTGGSADIRYDGTLKLLNSSEGIPPSTNGIAIDTAGNVGIGTIPTPPANIKLDVSGTTRLSPGGSGGTIGFGTPNAETGMTISGGVNRADLRFDGSTLKLVVGASAGFAPPPSTNGIAINSSGNVGIGTITPTSKLEIAAQDGLKISGFQPFLTLRDTNNLNKLTFVQNANGNLFFIPNSGVAGMTINANGSVGIAGNLVIGNGAGGIGNPGNLTVTNGMNVSNGLTVNSGSLIVNSGMNVSNGLTVDSGSLIVNSGSLSVFGSAFINLAGIGGDQDLCRNSSNRGIVQCSSSLRYKSNIQTYLGGLDVINRLRPITFIWKQSGQRDVGFGAEEVHAIEPLLTTRNDAGEIEGVKYKQISVILVNAIKEQQAQIRQQQRQIDALTKIICQTNPQAEVCQSIHQR